MRLIDADALIETFIKENVPWDGQINRLIINAPTVDPVIRGAWEAETRRYRCTKCMWMSFRASRYCPHCGAFMKDGKDASKDT